MKIYTITFIIALFSSLCFSQVLISLDPLATVPHNNALLDIKADSKGVIFTKASDITQFPFYNATAEDLFDDEAASVGTIIFNQEDGEYYKYDGTTWIPAKQLGAFYNPNLSRIKNNGTQSFTCVIGLGGCGSPKVIPITGTENRAQLLVNNLDVSITNGTNNEYFTIQDDGVYNVAGVVGFGSGTNILGLGQNILYRAYLEAQYPGSTEWITLAFKETKQWGGLFIDLGQSGNKSASITTTVTLVSGTKIRIGTVAKVEGLSLVSTYTTSAAHNETFINVQKIK